MGADMTRWLQAAKQEAGHKMEPTPGTLWTCEGQGIATGRGVMSVKSVLSRGSNPAIGAEAGKPDDPGADTFAHGQGINGDPRTWTGRVVSLADWRRLSQWDRHGPDGRFFYGDTRQWEKPRDPA